jgi:hypothetical protein
MAMDQGHIPPAHRYHSRQLTVQRRLNSLLAKTLPPTAIGFGENPIAALHSVVILSEAAIQVRLTRY